MNPTELSCPSFQENLFCWFWLHQTHHSFLPVSFVCPCFYYIIFDVVLQLCGVALDKSTVKILRYIQTHPNISLFDLKESFSDCNKNISYLCKEEYISNNIKGYSGVTRSAIHSNSFSIYSKRFCLP